MTWLSNFRASRNWMIVGVFSIICVTIIIYYPSLGIGFWNDDYLGFDWAERMSAREYLIRWIDPRVQTLWYRPMQGFVFGIEFVLFGVEPTGYHIVQIILHTLNCVLLFGLVSRISKNTRAAFLSIIIYATLPTYSLAVNWVSVTDPLLATLYLSSLWLWIGYLETARWTRFVGAVIAFVLALLTKEIGVTLPIVLFLADRWLLGKPASLSTLVKRYIWFFMILCIYTLLVFRIITEGEFVRNAGFAVGTHVFDTAIQYLTRLTFPWGLEPPLSYLWLLLVVAFFARALLRQNWSLLFIAAAAVVALMPVMPFHGIALRYMYIPLMASAIGYGMLCEKILAVIDRLPQRRLLLATMALSIGVGVVWSAQIIGGDVETLAGFARQTRLQLRPIFQRHPTLAPRTLLYFIDPPFLTLNLSGLIAIRYGTNAVTSGLDYEDIADVRNYNTAFIYYADEHSVLREQMVDPAASVRFTPNLPAQFEGGIFLRGVEAATTKVRPGEALVLLLYWSTNKKLDKDYTVVARLVDSSGSIVSEYESQPKRGKAPTSNWNVDYMISDAIILPIDLNTPVGDGYRVEIGLYYLPTIQRLSLVGAAGQAIGDTLVVESFSIVSP